MRGRQTLRKVKECSYKVKSSHQNRENISAAVLPEGDTMALVAYSDDSDLGTDSEDGDEVLEDAAQMTSGGEASVESLTRVSPAKLETGVDSIEDEDEDYSKSEKPFKIPSLFSSVPAAVPVSSLLRVGEEEEDEVVDVPTVETWKVTQELKKQNNNVVGEPQPGTQPVSTHKKERKKVKILLPSLSEVSCLFGANEPW